MTVTLLVHAFTDYGGRLVIENKARTRYIVALLGIWSKLLQLGTFSAGQEQVTNGRSDSGFQNGKQTQKDGVESTGAAESKNPDWEHAEAIPATPSSVFLLGRSDTWTSLGEQ